MTRFTGPLKAVCEGIFDGPHATPKETSEGPIFLGITNVTSDGKLDLSEIRHVSEQEFPRWTRRVLPQPNDIVFSYEATLHRYALIPEGFRGCLGRRMGLVRVNPGKADARFLYYYFLSRQWRAVVEPTVITGATVDRIPLTRFPDLPIDIPEVDEQKHVADVLAAYDSWIANNRRRISLLEEAAHLLFREWFVHFRFPGHEHVRIKDRIPEGWTQEPLENALILQRGFDLPIQDRKDGNVPIYGSTGISGYHNKTMVPGPGIVTGRSGSLGEVRYVSEDFWPLNTALWVKEFRRVTPLFALFLLRALDLRQYNGGVSVPTLDRNVVHKVKVLIPTSDLLAAFDQFAIPCYAQISNLTTQNAKLCAVRALLLPRLMSGEVAV